MLASPPIPSSACKGLFQAFDENNDGHIDFREMACGISACCRGSSSERQQFCFRVFDCDQDGFLSRDELELMSKILLQIRKENSPEKETDEYCDSILMAEEILSNCEKPKDGKVNLEEFQVWSNLHRFSLLFPKLLVQVCHIVLGLRPLTREVELQVIRGWLERENQQGLKPGTLWYLVSMSWWRKWKEFVNYQPTRRSSTGSVKKNGTIPSKPNQTANNTPTWSSESLRTRTILRRESHPSYPNTAVTKNESMNGHCTPEVEPGPGQIDNTSLIEPETRKVMILTGEGGRLKRSVPLGRGRDFEILPEPVWRALLTWYGGGPALPRTVVVPLNGDSTPELELFPLNLKIYRHSPPPTRGGITTWTGVGFGLSSFGFNTNSMTASHAPPKKYLAYLAAFSYINTLQQVLEYISGRLRIRTEDLRLWIMNDDNTLHLLEEENSSLRDLNLTDNMNLLLEVRNRDMSWPEEMSSLASSKSLREKLNLEPTEKGATGLSNLGNTCFMNSALQCLSNTQPLTQFFTAKCHYYELNRTNPLGMKGHIARRYGDLVEDLWSGSSRSLAPLKLRWTIGRYAPRFNGFHQHDAQEFLSFLLDGLHEDLNRVHDKPYVELKDSDGRLDEIVAQEAWDNHIKRNQSIIVDLFQGQLKSQVRCVECGYVSARFDPFTFLSLPLPMDNSIFIEIVVVPLSGATPVKYGLLLNNDDKYKAVRKELAKLCVINVAQLLLVEVYGATVKSLPTDSQKIRSALGGILYAYEVPENVYDTPTSSPSVASRQQIVTSFKKTPTIVPESEEDANKCESNAPPRLDNKPSSNHGQTDPANKPCERGPAKPDDTPSGTGEIGPAGSTRFTDSDKNSSRGTIESGDTDKNSNRGSSENVLRVEENWFSEDSKKKRRNSPSLLKRLSPKPRKNVSPKITVNSTNGDLRESSSSSSSELSSQGCSASDSGISMNNDQSPTIHNRRVGTGGDGVETPSSGPSPYLGYCFKGFVVAIHRKMNRSDAYFLSPQKNRPSLFGVPVVVPCTSRTKHCELYQTVWKQVSRLLSAPAPGDKNAKDGNTGDYPFELRVVQKDGVTCAWCSWFRFCRGCLIKCSDQEFGNSSSYIAIEWDPTTLHLRYQSSLEKNCEEHESVERSRRLQTEPIDLYECLRAFTNEEELGDEELWYCNKCKKHRLAVKKLEIWSLPPILVIHLKRFQYVNGHWVKSNKIVNYPMAGFDPSAFLVPRPPGSHLTVRRENTTVTTVTVRSSVKEEKEEDVEAEKAASNCADSNDFNSPFGLVTSGLPTSGPVTSGLCNSMSATSVENTNGCASCSSRDMDCSGATTSQVELNTKNNSRNSSISSLNSAKVHPEVSGSKVARDHSTPSPCRDGSCRDAPFRDGASHDVACRDGSCRDVPFRDGASPDSACPGIDCRDGPCHANGCCDDPSQENIRYRASSMSFKTPVYRLYAMSCHSGVLGGGHYISYSHNPNGKWYCYNDSSCKECDVNKMHVDSPYLLFYQQDDLNEKAFLPSVRDRTPDNVSDDEDFENDVKRMCSVQ
ncbi:ubiquitin carboxyl-terminal hydrolase 32-like isoform X2 [Nematostella vectensis]|nr:ubiquitin carboxyl-terminal hydrolase 32-like isoform X2 [Nematostella vectensis]XP_048582552.1 ubiquitin carboxyl-terminal hydrolase 32-like isoform X2 [Nematostella vectensis]